MTVNQPSFFELLNFGSPAAPWPRLNVHTRRQDEGNCYLENPHVQWNSCFQLLDNQLAFFRGRKTMIGLVWRWFLWDNWWLLKRELHVEALYHIDVLLGFSGFYVYCRFWKGSSVMSVSQRVTFVWPNLMAEVEIQFWKRAEPQSPIINPILRRDVDGYLEIFWFITVSNSGVYPVLTIFNNYMVISITTIGNITITDHLSCPFTHLNSGCSSST